MSLWQKELNDLLFNVPPACVHVCYRCASAQMVSPPSPSFIEPAPLPLVNIHILTIILKNEQNRAGHASSGSLAWILHAPRASSRSLIVHRISCYKHRFSWSSPLGIKWYYDTTQCLRVVWSVRDYHCTKPPLVLFLWQCAVPLGSIGVLKKAKYTLILCFCAGLWYRGDHRASNVCVCLHAFRGTWLWHPETLLCLTHMHPFITPHLFLFVITFPEALCTAYHIWTWRERGRVDGLSLLCCQKQWKVVYSRWEYIVSWVEGVHVYRLHGGGCFCSSRPWRRALLKREGHSNMLSIGLMLTDGVLSCVCGQDVHVAEKVTHPPLVYLQIIIGRGWGDDPVFLLLQCLQSVLLSHSHSCTASFKTHQ